MYHRNDAVHLPKTFAKIIYGLDNVDVRTLTCVPQMSSAQGGSGLGGQASRIIQLLVLSLIAVVATMLLAGTQMRNGCAGTSDRSSSASGANISAASSEATATKRYTGLTEHSVCRFFRTAWNQSHETMW
jgi:hypothetical protein